MDQAWSNEKDIYVSMKITYIKLQNLNTLVSSFSKFEIIFIKKVYAQMIKGSSRKMEAYVSFSPIEEKCIPHGKYDGII